MSDLFPIPLAADNKFIIDETTTMISPVCLA